jgi:hypothetical protein
MTDTPLMTCEECKRLRASCHEVCVVVREAREDRLVRLESRVDILEHKMESKFSKLNAMGWATLGGLCVNLVILVVSHILKVH